MNRSNANPDAVKRLTDDEVANIRFDLANTKPSSSPMGLFRQHCEDLLNEHDALCATVRVLRRDTERTYTPSIVEALRLLDGAGYGKEVPNSLSDMIKKVLAERDNLLSRSHQTVNFECGCVFRQDGLDAEPQLIEHCTLWAEMERNAMIDTIAESEKENTALREQLAEAQAEVERFSTLADEERDEQIGTWDEFVAKFNKKYPRLPLYDTENCKRYVQRAVKFITHGHVD